MAKTLVASGDGAEFDEAAAVRKYREGYLGNLSKAGTLLNMGAAASERMASGLTRAAKAMREASEK